MFVHVTVDPRARVSVAGKNEIFCITTAAADGVGVPGVGVTVGPVDVGVNVALTGVKVGVGVAAQKLAGAAEFWGELGAVL